MCKGLSSTCSTNNFVGVEGGRVQCGNRRGVYIDKHFLPGQSVAMEEVSGLNSGDVKSIRAGLEGWAFLTPQWDDASMRRRSCGVPST